MHHAGELRCVLLRQRSPIYCCPLLSPVLRCPLVIALGLPTAALASPTSATSGKTHIKALGFLACRLSCGADKMWIRNFGNRSRKLLATCCHLKQARNMGLTCRVRMSSGDVSVRAPMIPHMRLPSHLPSSPISSPVRASHACASGQYSCSRYPLSIPACMTGASSRGSLHRILGHEKDCTAAIYHKSMHHAFSITW